MENKKENKKILTIEESNPSIVQQVKKQLEKEINQKKEYAIIKPKKYNHFLMIEYNKDSRMIYPHDLLKIMEIAKNNNCEVIASKYNLIVTLKVGI